MKRNVNKREALLEKGDLREENVRIRISINLPVDLVVQYKARAKKEDMPYQTLMTTILRKHLKEEPLESRLWTVEKKLNISHGRK